MIPQVSEMLMRVALMPVVIFAATKEWLVLLVDIQRHFARHAVEGWSL